MDGHVFSGVGVAMWGGGLLDSILEEMGDRSTHPYRRSSDEVALGLPSPAYGKISRLYGLYTIGGISIRMHS